MQFIKKNLSKSNMSLAIFCIFAGLFIVIESQLTPMSKAMPANDSAVFIYIGKQMQNGLLPYKDLFDHKGPVLYFIQYFGLALANGGVIGIWLIELLLMLFNVLFMYKCAALFTDENKARYLAVVLSFLPLLRFFQGGNFTEEYALPCIIYSLYVYLKYLKRNEFRYFHVILTGCCCGIVLGLRPNLIGLWMFFIPYIMFCLIRKKEWLKLLWCSIAFLAGVILLLLPILYYFIKNDILQSMIDVYIIFNLQYTQFYNGVSEVIKTGFYFWNSNILFPLTIPILFASSIKFKKQSEIIRINIAAFVYIIVTFSMIVISGQQFGHYGMILIPCLIIPMVYLSDWICLYSKKCINNRKILIVLCSAILCLMFFDSFLIHCYLTFSNLKSNQKDTQIAEYIDNHTKEGDNILVLGLAAKYYLCSQRYTEYRLFYQYPVLDIRKPYYKQLTTSIEKNPPILVLYPGNSIDEKIPLYNYFIQMTKKDLYTLEKHDNFIIFLLKDKDHL